MGSTCNACDDANPQNATLLRARPDGSRRRIFATGLRNTIGFAWDPRTRRLWGMDHGSDFRGDDQPPEELNLIRRGGDYGWPFCFGAQQPDLLLPGPPPRPTRAGLCARTRTPALTYQAHSAPIGFAFATSSVFPAGYRDDAFAAMHGSWNRGVPVGYKVVRVVFEDGRPVGFEDFVTGFLIEDGRRPVRPAHRDRLRPGRVDARRRRRERRDLPRGRRRRLSRRRRSAAVHAQVGGELREHGEVVVLRPHRQVVDQGGGGDDGVHDAGTPTRGARARHQVGEALGHRLVIGEGDEAAGSRERGRSRSSHRLTAGPSQADAELRDRRH